ncbi:hypothetical protein QD336_23930 [Rhizobium sp. BR 250]
MQKPHVSDNELSELVDWLYRPNASIGSGSTADAIRFELSTGKAVGGAFHGQKAQDGIVALQRWLSKNPTAPSGGRAAAENIILRHDERIGWKMTVGSRLRFIQKITGLPDINELNRAGFAGGSNF